MEGYFRYGRVRACAERLLELTKEGDDPRKIISEILNVAFEAGMKVDLGGLEGGEIVIRTGYEYQDGGRSLWDLTPIDRAKGGA